MKKPVSIRTKPVTIEAIRWTGDNLEAVQAFVGKARQCPDDMQALNREGFTGQDIEHMSVWDYLHQAWIPVFVGQWVLRGLEGEFYPCAESTLWAKYERVDPEDPSGPKQFVL